MKFKLKSENSYVSGGKDEWLKCDQIYAENINITAQSTNKYTIYWLWDDENTNNIKDGKSNYSDYVLRIQINSKIYNTQIGE